MKRTGLKKVFTSARFLFEETSLKSGKYMHQDLMEILACPICKGDLELVIGKQDGEEIVEGTIKCKKCNIDYPVEDGIPNMLPPDERE
jgi:uncharacterized protein YbaR (Trm112 family)